MRYCIVDIFTLSAVNYLITGLKIYACPGSLVLLFSNVNKVTKYRASYLHKIHAS